MKHRWEKIRGDLYAQSAISDLCFICDHLWPNEKWELVVDNFSLLRGKQKVIVDLRFRMAARSYKRLMHECELWRKGSSIVAGVDEAGRGPLAGPVLAAAVVLPQRWLEAGLDSRLRDLNDSKQLTEPQREHFYFLLTTHPEIRYAIAIVDADMIDGLNILRATHRAMNHALSQLQPPPEHVLVDGLPVRSILFPQTALVEGDARSYSIAAASVLAKVTRDRMMVEFDKLYPGYGFAVHKGYGTPQHYAAIQELGPCPIHRRSFAPFRPVEMEMDLFKAPPLPPELPPEFRPGPRPGPPPPGT